MKYVLLSLILILALNSSVVIAQDNPGKEIARIKKELRNSSGAVRARQLLSLSGYYLSIDADSAFMYAGQSLNLSRALKNDTLAGRSYLVIGHYYRITGNDSLSLAAYQQAFATFKKNNDSANIAKSYMSIGQYYYYKGDDRTALDFYFRSLEIYKALRNPKLYCDIIDLLNEIGYMYYNQNNYEQALHYLFAAINITGITGDKGFRTSNLYTTIGSIYFDWKRYDKSLEYFLKAFDINKTIGNKSNLAYSLNYLGMVYYSLGQYDTAFYYNKTAAGLFTELKDNVGISASYEYIGNYYSVKKKYNIALKYYNTALASCEQNKQQLLVSSLLYEIGKTYYNMNIPAKALEYSYRSLAIARSIAYKDNINFNYLLLSDIYSAMDSCNNAFAYYKKYSLQKDSIFTLDVHKQISDMQEKYEADKKAREIKILRQKEEIQNISLHKQRVIMVFLILLALLFSILAAVIFVSLRQKRKANKIIAAEKQKSDNLLMNILPEQTAEELKEKGFASTRYYERVTVLFTDFAGFTAIAEKMTPEKLVSELDYCFRSFDMIVGKHNIEKIKTIGDSYMCAGGLPEPNTTNPADVVRCGLAFRDFMLKYKEERERRNEPHFEVRIGIHTGPVVSGIVGTRKFAYDIWGDTVNTAARMESSGKPGCVNISGDTYKFIKDQFRCTERGKVEAKSKGFVDMYFVECPLED